MPRLGPFLPTRPKPAWDHAQVRLPGRGEMAPPLPSGSESDCHTARGGLWQMVAGLTAFARRGGGSLPVLPKVPVPYFFLTLSIHANTDKPTYDLCIIS